MTYLQICLLLEFIFYNTPMIKKRKINIENNLKQIRKAKGFTLAEISKLTGIQLATLSRIQNGRMPGTLETNIAIADVLDVPLADLFKKMPPSTKSSIKNHSVCSKS